MQGTLGQCPRCSAGLGACRAAMRARLVGEMGLYLHYRVFSICGGKGTKLSQGIDDGLPEISPAGSANM